MPDTQDQALIAALNRLAAGQAGGDDLSRLQQAVAEGRLTLQSAERTISVPGNLTGSTVLDGDSQSGGVNSANPTRSKSPAR